MFRSLDLVVYKLMVEWFWTDVSSIELTFLELLFKKEVISCRTLVLYVVRKKAFGLRLWITNVLHGFDYLFIDRNTIKTYVNAETIDLCKIDEPGMLFDLFEPKTVLRTHIYEFT